MSTITDQASYYVMHADVQRGPFTFKQLDNLWGLGQLTSETMYWEEGMTDWEPLSALISWKETEATVSAPAYNPEAIAFMRAMRLKKKESEFSWVRVVSLLACLPLTVFLAWTLGVLGFVIGMATIIGVLVAKR